MLEEDPPQKGRLFGRGESLDGHPCPYLNTKDGTCDISLPQSKCIGASNCFPMIYLHCFPGVYVMYL